MKKYHTTFPCYGQSVAGRIAHHQKMGVAQGIMLMWKHHMNHDLAAWKYSIEVGNGKSLECLAITAVIPTPDNRKELFDYPMFWYNGRRGYIDMIHMDSSELQFHIMFYNRENRDKGSWENGYWHTVRECLSLEDTCTLFEYVEDRLKDLIILAPEDGNKYNSTGALGISL